MDSAADYKNLKLKLDGLVPAGGGFFRNISELGACGLRKDRNGVGDIGAEIDVPGIDGFEQRQAVGEFMP